LNLELPNAIRVPPAEAAGQHDPDGLGHSAINRALHQSQQVRVEVTSAIPSCAFLSHAQLR